MTDEPELSRHFTATAFVVWNGCVSLHWHDKIQAWLPAGGHIEPNEDPVQAVTREALEETGLEVEVVATGADLGLSYPEQVTPPFTIMIEDIHDPVDGFHKHIDMIYFCRPTSGSSGLSEGWKWVSREALASSRPLLGGVGVPVAPPEDVKVLGIRAIEFVEGSPSEPVS